jgi:hypothetical protein
MDIPLPVSKHRFHRKGAKNAKKFLDEIENMLRSLRLCDELVNLPMDTKEKHVFPASLR